MENLDAGRMIFTTHLGFRQHHAIITECWNARMKVISVELFVKKFLRFLEEWNAKTSGVKEVLAFANEGVSGGAAKR